MTISWRKLPLNEWRRRPMRTAVTVIGVALAAAMLFSVLGFERGYRRGMQGELDRLGAHVLVVPKGCPYDAASLALHGARWPCRLPAAYLAELRLVQGVAAAVPALMNALPDETGLPVVYLGTDSSILKLRPQWRVKGRFPEQGGELLAGSGIATRLGWQVGETVALPGLPRQTGLVVGVLEPTQGADDFFLHVPLAEAQRLFNHPGELTHILVRLKDPTELDAVVQRLRGCDGGMSLNVVPLAHLFRSMQQLMNSTRWLLFSVVLVGLIVAATGVSNALLMAVSERFREFGVFRALGASPGDLFRLVLTEALVLCAAGAALGIAGALIGDGFIETWLRARVPFLPAGRLVGWDSSVAAACMSGIVALGALAALVPAWRAVRVYPAEALRHHAYNS